MGRRSRKAQWYDALRGPTAAREALERRWHHRLEPAPGLALLVTARGTAREPFHRWLAFKQGFSPELVRCFLHEAEGIERVSSEAPVLDPFSGSGTCVIECARQGTPALGTEAVEVLAFLANARFADRFSPLPALPQSDDWREIADFFVEPVHRAALMLSAARACAGGKGRAGPPNLFESLSHAAAIMTDDLRKTLTLRNTVDVGDARNLAHLADGSVGAVLTSPPYLSRHDYANKTALLEQVYRHWYPRADLALSKDAQVRAAIKVPGKTSVELGARPVQARGNTPNNPESTHPPGLHEAIDEAAAVLASSRHDSLVPIVLAYFHGMGQALQELARVARRGGPIWLVVGGARVKGVYIPSDLILAELAQRVGFSLSTVRVARRLIEAGRKLGTLNNVSPRESVIIMRRE